MKKYILYLLILPIVNLFFSCEKDITLKLPNTPQQIVVEGSIEQNSPPVVILTRTIGYFKPADSHTLESLFIHNATVTVSDESNTYTLSEICSQNLPDSIQNEIAASAGVTQKEIQSINYCVYTTFNTAAFGKLNHTYNLTVNVNDTVLTATTTIPKLIAPDSLWFETVSGSDSLGYIHFTVYDPPGKGNAWRIFTQRLHKDARLIPTLGSVFDDQYLDGKKISFYFVRGSEFNSQAPDDNNNEAGYYKIGDTVAVKFCSIDETSYKFWSTEENAIFSNGNPFASPTTIESNINGGLGVWCGYAAAYDTVIAK